MKRRIVWRRDDCTLLWLLGKKDGKYIWVGRDGMCYAAKNMKEKPKSFSSFRTVVSHRLEEQFFDMRDPDLTIWDVLCILAPNAELPHNGAAWRLIDPLTHSSVVLYANDNMVRKYRKEIEEAERGNA